MLVSFLFTVWIIVATVSSGEARESTETSTEIHDSSSDEKTSDESNEEVKDTSDEKDSGSTEKDDSGEDNSSAEKDSSSTEQTSSEERENKSSDESSEEGHKRSYVQPKNKEKKKKDKFTKTTRNTFKPGSNLPPCAICNFQAGGIFVPWSIPCTGCSYRAPSCSSMGICCVMSSGCANVQQGKPCPVNSYLGLPMQSSASLVSNSQLNLPVGSPMPGTIQQMQPGMNTIDITTTQIFQGPNGKYGVNIPAIRTTGTSSLYGKTSTTNGLISNNMLNNPVYQSLGLQTMGNVWGGGSMINTVCPSTKAACATLGGTCIPSTQFCGGVHKQDEQLCGSNCKCCIKPKNKDCSDNNKNCLQWASAGYCTTYPHIKAECKVSCGICKPNPGEGTPLASSQDKCRDKIPNCKSVATGSSCATYVKMKELCPITCGVGCPKSQSPAQVDGGVCSRLTQNTCTDVLAGKCIPLNEPCGGWFKEDPTLCGTGNCKCCITQRCNVAPEDTVICSHLGGKCIPATTKCRGTNYPLCGSNTCQCCVDNPNASGSCSANQKCGAEGTCTLGGCHEGFEVTEGQCAGPECYCCKKIKEMEQLRRKAMSFSPSEAYGTCSDKQCGNGGTCRDITCLPGEVRLKENCGKGNCVCCKLAQEFDSALEESCKGEPCGNGGKCHCSKCAENEERIDGECSNRHCACCRTKIEGTNKSYVRPSAPTNIQPYDHQHPVNVLKSKEGPRYPESRKIPRPSQPLKYWNEYSSYPKSFSNDMPPSNSVCRSPRTNRCQKKGGICIPLEYSCNGDSIVKYCGHSNTCKCCVPDPSHTDLPYYYGKSEADSRSFSHSDQLIEPEENIGPFNPPPISFTNDEIETIQNIKKDSTELLEEDDKSKAEVNIESLFDDKNLNQAIDKGQPMAVTDAKSVLDESSIENSGTDKSDLQLTDIKDLLDIKTAASLVSDIKPKNPVASDNKTKDSDVKIPSHTTNTPMDLGHLVKTPSIKDPLESNYEMNILPELNMIDYYDSMNMPLDETEIGLYSDEYYEMSDIKSMINNGDKNIKIDNDALNDDTATDLTTLQKASEDHDIINNMLSKKLYPSLDVNENSGETIYAESVPANSLMDLEDYYENYYTEFEIDSNTPIVGSYYQAEESQSLERGAYQSNYNMYPSMDEGYYMENYPSMNRYDAQY